MIVSCLIFLSFPKEKHFLWLYLLQATLHIQSRETADLSLVSWSQENEKPCLDLMVLTINHWEVLKLELDAVTKWGLSRYDRNLDGCKFFATPGIKRQNLIPSFLI